jgi:hypothetical protein
MARPSPPSAEVDGRGASHGELRLRVLGSLPRSHQQYLFEEIRKLCVDYLRNRRVPASEMTPEELLSEVWQKLLGDGVPGQRDAAEFHSGESE